MPTIAQTDDGSQKIGTAPTCPRWCTAHMDDDGSDGAVNPVVHQHPVGSLGVAVEWCPSDPAPAIYLPEADIDECHVTADFARQLGEDLILASVVLSRHQHQSAVSR